MSDHQHIPEKDVRSYKFSQKHAEFEKQAPTKILRVQNILWIIVFCMHTHHFFHKFRIRYVQIGSKP